MADRNLKRTVGRLSGEQPRLGVQPTTGGQRRAPVEPRVPAAREERISGVDRLK